MKKYALAGAAAIAALVSAAQINDTNNAGHMAQAREMATLGNYSAALDRLRTLDRPALSPDEREAADMLHAECLLRTGRYSEGAEAFATFAAAYPFSARHDAAVKGMGDCLYAQGRYDEAMNVYSDCYADALNSGQAAELYYRRGICALETGDKATARKAFEKASLYANTRSAAMFYLGRLDFEDGKYAEARERFKNANTSVEPGNMADYYLASIDFIEGNYSRALSTARQMLRRSVLPKDAEAEMNRIAGEAAFKLGQSQEAVTYLKKYIGAVNEPAPSALYIIGVADFDEGRYGDAIYRFTPVTERGTGALRQSAYLYMGQCLLEQGDAEAAILAFDKASKSTDDSAVREAAFYNYAVAKFAGADVPFASASATFEEFLRLYPSGPYSDRVASYLAAGYIADKDYEMALSRINSISMPSPAILKAKQRVLYTLGLNALREGRLPQAQNYLVQAETLASHDAAVAAEVVLAQAEVMQAQGNNSDAAAKYQLYLRMADHNAENRPTALYGLAYALYNSGQATRATSFFEEAEAALDAPEAKADALNRLGDLRFAAADFNGAADYYARAFAANPAAGDYATLNAARMKGYQRDYKGKLTLLEAFRKDFSGSVLMPDALLETTQALISLGRNDDAIATYRTLINEYPQTAQGRQGYLQMAMTLLDMGRNDKAAEAYKSVISKYPSSEEAVQAASLLKNLYAGQGRGDEFLGFMAGVDKAPAISADDAEEISYESAVKAYESRGETRQLEAFAQRYPTSQYASAVYGLLLDKAIADKDNSRQNALADRIIAQYPDSRASEKALRIKAEAAYTAGELPQALRYWQTLEPKASDAGTATAARLGIMRTARGMGEHSIAEEAADAILASSASPSALAEARHTKAAALMASDRTEQAIALWQELAKNPSDLYGARAAYEAATALHETGKDMEALDTALKLTRSGSSQRYWVARAFILISDIYSSQGKTFEAREYLEALRDNYPGSETDIFMMIESRLGDDNKTDDNEN